MRRLFGEMDLYKAIILACVLLMPAAGFWVYWLGQRLGKGEAALVAAKRQRNGDLQSIGLLQQEIDNMIRNAGSAEAERDPRVYFDQQINSASPDLKRSDYVIEELQPQRIGAINAVDQQIKIDFKEDGRKQFAMTRELITYIVFNCESQSPAWRLRSLHLRNEETKDLRAGSKRPPAEVADNWLVDKMVFARRAPDPRARRR